MHPIEEKIPSLPCRPGVYIMKGVEDAILYVGKAKNLRSRLKAYTGSGRQNSPKVNFLVSKVRDLDYIVTQTEKEALLLENTLIKKHRPRYNIDLKDDKTYLHILLDRNHPFPRFVSVRRPGKAKPGKFVFGPYSSAMAVRDTLRQIHRLYPLRTCKDREFRARKRPCIQAQMGRCSGACVGEITEEAYREMVDQSVLILQGRSEELVRQQEKKMQEEAESMRFEEAAQIRDRIQAIRLTMEKQRVVDARGADRDVVGTFQEGGLLGLALLEIRGGSLVERKSFLFPESVISLPELLRSFLLQYYSRDEQTLPPEVLVPEGPEDRETLGEVLSEIRGATFSIRIPKRGEKRRLVELAGVNAKSLWEEHTRKSLGPVAALEELRKKLGMPNPPGRIECFDISNLQGELAVGSCVVFRDGLPFKEGYRRFRIRKVKGVDDYGMMYEVLVRRIERGVKEDDLPDLLLIDGGKGHLNVATRVLKDLGVQTIHAAAIAKVGKRERGGGREEQTKRAYFSDDAGSSGSVAVTDTDAVSVAEEQDEHSAGLTDGTGRVPGKGDGPHENGSGEKDTDRIFLPGRANPVGFPVYSKGLRMLQQIRDEAHRFALTYHRKLRSREIERSELDAIQGIGPKRKRALLNLLGDLEKVKLATAEDLSKIPGMNDKAARAVWEHFRKS